VADQEEVVTGLRRPHGRLAHRARLGHRPHLQVVGDDHALEAHLLAQVLADDAPGERRRHPRRVQLGVDGVRGHHADHPGLDGGEERRQVSAPHLGPVGLDPGQAQVRVERRVALAREVLGARQQAGGGHAADARRAQPRDQRRVLAVGTDADVGTVALGEDVEHGAEVQVHAEAAQFAALDHALSVGEGLVAHGADGQVVGKDRRAPAQHDDAATLVVGRHQQAPAQRGLQALHQAPQPVRRLEVPAVENQPAGPRVAEEPDVLVAQVRAGQPDHQSLADQILERRHEPDCTGPPAAGPRRSCRTPDTGAETPPSGVAQVPVRTNRAGRPGPGTGGASTGWASVRTPVSAPNANQEEFR
jgi:hypothetical protein